MTMTTHFHSISIKEAPICIICKDWIKGSLTSKEALRNLGEFIDTSKEEEVGHYLEVMEKVSESIIEEEVKKRCSPP